MQNTQKTLKILQPYQHVTAQYKLLMQSRSSPVQHLRVSILTYNAENQKKMICYSSTESVMLSTMCLDV